MSFWSWVLQVSGGILAIGGAAALLRKGAQLALKLLRKIEEFLDDWQGAPGRPGVPERPGVMQRLIDSEARQVAMEARLAAMEEALTEVRHEVKPNSGTSLKDQITRIEEQVTAGV